MRPPKEQFLERHRGGERAILVQLEFPSSEYAAELTEFKELVLSANLEILTVISGKRTKPDSQYYVGKGKAFEIQEQVIQLDAEVVIFNHELSPAQGRDLEKLFNVKVIDRTELILDIFAQRAQTFEGQLQVELAQLQHLSTRLVRGWTHLERQKGGIGLRGPGETQLETDRRLLSGRIKNIKKRLEKVAKQRQLGRRARQRNATPTVALVGYTNAGKSTLFNKLTKADAYVADQLFATLDPTLRKITLPQVGEVILADTVGFIRDLPHDLVAAFRATLEETRQADLLLHVVDSQGKDLTDIKFEVERVLGEIGADNVPQLLVYNKIDLNLDLQAHIDTDAEDKPYRVWVSAQTGQGIEQLLATIHQLLIKRLLHCEVTLTPGQGKLRAKLYALGAIQSETTDDSGNHILELAIEQSDYTRWIIQDE